MTKPRSTAAFHATAFLGLAILLTVGAAAQASATAASVCPVRPIMPSGAKQDDSGYSLLSCFAKTAKRLHGQAVIAEVRVHGPGLAARNPEAPMPEDQCPSAAPVVANHLIDLPPPAL